MKQELFDKLKAINPELWRVADPGVGDGWFKIIEDLSRQLAKLSSVTVATQVKEKFGALRFYVTGATIEGHEAISAAEDASAKTCELCGEPGELRSDAFWMSTRCDACAIKQSRWRNR